MKQGHADRSGAGSRKVEPNSRAINPGGVDALGQSFGNHSMEGGTGRLVVTPLDAGRGYSAPGIGTTTHRSGSQGKHR
jgi:hypothetical protein